MWATFRNLTVLLVLSTAATAAHAATIPVTTTSDGLANDGQCTLREAVFATRVNGPFGGCPGDPAGVDTIVLGPGNFELAPTPGGADEDGGETGDLDTGPLNAFRIVGAGAGSTSIDGLLGSRILEINPNSSVTLEGVTLRRGRSGLGAPGGAVQNQGTLVLLRVNVEDSAAGSGAELLGSGGSGGAIWSGGTASPTVLISESVFRGNAAGAGSDGAAVPSGLTGGGRGGDGGALAIEAGTADVSATTFTDNRAGAGGAGISGPTGAVAEGPGGNGGALAVSGPASVSVVNSTFAGNAAGGTGASPFPNNRRGGEGGGAASAGVAGSLRISWSTFVGNTASPQSPPNAARAVGGGQVSASIVADSAPACRVSAPAGLANVVLPGDASCAGPQIAGDPRLGPLAANGGPTPTALPGPGSAAIDALAGVPCPGTDQRGLPRPAVGGCDAGAVEVQPLPAGPPDPGGAGAAAAGARSISAVAIGPSVFRATGRRPRGARVTFRLSTAGEVVLTVRRRAAGRRAGARCVAPSRRLRSAKRCVRRVTLAGTLRRTGAAGLNVLRFSGRLRGRALPPGRYTLVLTLPAAGGAPAVSAARGFRILR